MTRNSPQFAQIDVLVEVCLPIERFAGGLPCRIVPIQVGNVFPARSAGQEECGYA